MCSYQLLFAHWTNGLAKWLKYVNIFWVQPVPYVMVLCWFLKSQQIYMATRISGVQLVRRICSQDYASDATASSVSQDLWQILYSGVILLCTCTMMVLENIREKWSASLQRQEGICFWFNPITVPCESDSEKGALLLSVHPLSLSIVATNGWFVLCHIYSPSYVLHLCLGTCMIATFLKLRKVKIKNFTVLKPRIFFLLQTSGSFIPQWKLLCLCHKSLLKLRDMMRQ